MATKEQQLQQLIEKKYLLLKDSSNGDRNEDLQLSIYNGSNMNKLKGILSEHNMLSEDGDSYMQTNEYGTITVHYLSALEIIRVLLRDEEALHKNNSAKSVLWNLFQHHPILKHALDINIVIWREN